MACPDAVLKGIAEVFRGELRHYDVPARFGGEEFSILLPETPPELASRRTRLVDNGTVLEVVQPADEELGPVLAAALASGLPVRDVETRRSDLEDIYVQLLGKAAS